ERPAYQLSSQTGAILKHLANFRKILPPPHCASAAEERLIVARSNGSLSPSLWCEDLMYLPRKKLVGGVSALGGMPRRQLFQVAGALGLSTILRPTAAFAEPHDEDDERLGPFGPGSTPVNLGPVVNSPYNDFAPAISKDGLSLYITSTRPGGANGANPGNVEEIWVSQRVSLDAAWQTPVNLDAVNHPPVINSLGSVGPGEGGHNTHFPNFSPDGHLMYFDSPRPGGCGGADFYVSRRKNKRDDFGWQEPVNSGAPSTVSIAHILIT